MSLPAIRALTIASSVAFTVAPNNPVSSLLAIILIFLFEPSKRLLAIENAIKISPELLEAILPTLARPKLARLAIAFS